MVQCETCKVWQHGLCMGYESEDQLHDDDYYCEECRPGMHVELLRKLNKRPRHSSATAHPTTTLHASRVSRSHSPSHIIKQTSKRRNTMNSRDAAFDESLKEIMEATAAEAAAAALQGQSDTPPEVEDEDANANGRKKRKRSEDDAPPKKRTRSASTASDHPPIVRDETPTATNVPTKAVPQAPASKPAARNKRGGRKQPTAEGTAGEGEEVPANKRQSNSNRSKNASAKRPPASTAPLQGAGNSSHESGSRRSQPGGVNVGGSGANALDASRAYKNSHAYVVSQQPLYTSWGLPDYLGHLEQLLPTDIPKPLEVLSGPGVSGLNNTNGPIRGDSIERTTERGVKVKWPSKRMSVGDMNKRVRALLEWVGREQANAQDRGRRKEALEQALKEEQRRQESQRANQVTDLEDGDVQMVDQNQRASPAVPTQSVNGVPQNDSQGSNWDQGQYLPPDNGLTTMQLMEQLMEELIGFQERFGPGAKNRERERRTTTVVS
ncbi:hypothetical protein AX16_000729 [Volvariella volvacea WC 439]|nr:hypothetical protein AX16_000729 [Volvariella volvacea WC 439]